ncbi:hypothetical protein [Myxococcus sp. Y35]|uniref:hypothetical protein n=1 Tax=Pseudomyxococcus flavus TaxID=3115648 RepID=UPI003CEBE371
MQGLQCAGVPEAREEGEAVHARGISMSSRMAHGRRIRASFSSPSSPLPAVTAWYPASLQQVLE